MSTPRKQHYLPQFYLRGFSLDGRGIFQLEKLTGKHYACQIKDAAAIKDFHELDYEGAEDPHALEKHLATVEAKFATHLCAFVRDGVDNELARQHTVQLLSLMRLRVPAFKAHVEASYPSSIRKIAEFMERDGKLPKPPPGLEEKLRVKNLRIQVLNWKTMEVIFKMAGEPRLLDGLFRMRTTLYTAPPGMSFVTSDQPVATYHPAAYESPCGVGPETPGVELTFALDASKLIRLDHSTAPHSSELASPALVVELNRRTVAMAQRYVFTASRPEGYLDLLEATKDIRAGFVFDDFDRGDAGLLQLHRFLAVGPAHSRPPAVGRGATIATGR